jgi:hypothetical protein
VNAAVSAAQQPADTVPAEVDDHGFVPDYGFLLHGTRTRTATGAVTWDRDRSSVFLRLIKDFRLDDPVSAAPALLSVAKEGDDRATLTIDSTIQVDIRPAGYRERRLSAGVEIERETAGRGRNVQTYYATASVFVWHGGALESSYFRISPIVEDNRDKRLTRLAGGVLWQPGVRLGRFSTDEWLALGRAFEWYVTPRAAVDLGRVLRTPTGIASPDVTNGSVEVLAGAKAGPGFKATYQALWRFPLGNDVTASGYQEASVRWSFDPFDRFSVKGSLARGRKSVLDDDTRVARVGFGLKF